MIYTEEKAKVVATVWGTEFIQFLAGIHPFHHIVLVQIASADRN